MTIYIFTYLLTNEIKVPERWVGQQLLTNLGKITFNKINFPCRVPMWNKTECRQLMCNMNLVWLFFRVDMDILLWSILTMSFSP